MSVTRGRQWERKKKIRRSSTEGNMNLYKVIHTMQSLKCPDRNVVRRALPHAIWSFEVKTRFCCRESAYSKYCEWPVYRCCGMIEACLHVTLSSVIFCPLSVFYCAFPLASLGQYDRLSVISSYNLDGYLFLSIRSVSQPLFLARFDVFVVS